MINKDKMTEAELAGMIVHFLENELWECFFEVEGPGGRADIIGKSGPIIHVFEVKLNLNWAVLEQAIRWRQYAHYVTVAVQAPKNCSTGLANNAAIKAFMKYKGIGMIQVRHNIPSWKAAPQILRKAWTERISLTEEHKTWKKPGEVGGGYYTAFGATKQTLIRYVTDNPGCSMADIMANVPHHYGSDKSAKSCLHNYMVKGTAISGIRVEPGNPTKYFFDEEYQFRGIEKSPRPKSLDGYMRELTGGE